MKLVSSVCNTETLDTDSIFTQLMTKETLVNTVSLQIRFYFFSTTSNIYHLLQVLGKIVLSRDNKIGKGTVQYHYNSVLHTQNGCLRSGVQSEGKAEVEDTQSSGIITS